MSTKLESFFLLLLLLVLCIICPFKIKQQKTEFLMETQRNYEADYLAWEIQTYQSIDVSLLPDKTIEFYCYNEYMELVKTISAGTTSGPLDFSPYFCVIFTHKGVQKGVCLES